MFEATLEASGRIPPARPVQLVKPICFRQTMFRNKPSDCMFRIERHDYFREFHKLGYYAANSVEERSPIVG